MRAESLSDVPCVRRVLKDCWWPAKLHVMQPVDEPRLGTLLRECLAMYTAALATMHTVARDNTVHSSAANIVHSSASNNASAQHSAANNVHSRAITNLHRCEVHRHR